MGQTSIKAAITITITFLISNSKFVRIHYLQARRTLIQHNLRLVRKMVSTYFSKVSVPLPDLMHAGVEGLQRAIDKFDFSRRLKLSTYATPWVIAKMRHCTLQQASAGCSIGASALVKLHGLGNFACRRICMES